MAENRPPQIGPFPAMLPDAPEMPPMYADPLAARKEEIRRTDPPFIRSLRDRRRASIDPQWILNLDCFKAVHRHPGFVGEWFNHYIPMGRVKILRFVKKVAKQLWPAPDALEVYPADDHADSPLGPQAEAIKNYLTWRLWRCRARSLTKQIVLCLCLYQRAITKVYLDMRDVPGQIWPSFMVVDPFNFYIWPETATNIDQAQVLVEHSMMPYAEYDLLAQIGACDPINVTALTKPDWPSEMIERLSRAGLTPPSDAATGGNSQNAEDPIKLVAITERWQRMGPAWEQCWMVWNLPNAPVIVRLTQQPVAPYRMAVDRQLPGEHYMPAMMGEQEPLNVLFNDQINMGLESTATSAFPIFRIDSDRVTKADSFIIGPRRKWIGEEGAVEVLNVPNTGNVSLQGAQMTMGLMDAFTGASPLAEGTPARGMPRAGFAVSSLIALSLTDVTDMAELIEDELFTPLLSDMHRLTIGYPGFPYSGVPPQQLVSVPGAEGVTAWRGTVSQLIGACSFRWVGTLQAQDQQVRAQRLLTLLGTIAKIYPQMVTQGWDIDFGTLFKRIWRDGMGERGADSLVSRSQQYQMFQQFQAMLQQMQGGQPGQPMPGSPLPGGMPSPGGGGAQAPAPATAEQGQRQDSRAMGESSVGQMLSGIGVG